MRYLIEVTQIETKEIPETVYINESEREDPDQSYVTKLVKRDVETKIYTQLREEIDMPAIINAVNKE